MVIGMLYAMPSLITCSPLMGFHNVWQAFDEMDRHMHEMHQQMQLVFTEMEERTAENKIEVPDYQLQMKERDDAVVIMMEFPKSVKLEHVSVVLEDDVLDVLVEHDGKVELKITPQMVTISAATLIKHEKKDADGKVQIVSSGSSHMSQTMSLPARVDFQRVAPQADLTDGMLSIILAKKGNAQKIQVTSANSRPQVLAMPVDEQKDFDIK